jgi:hypothetical protein
MVESPYLSFRRYSEAVLPAPRLGLAGFFELELVHIRTGLVARHLRFKNIITDVGLDAVGTAQIPSLVSYCAVGTGSTPAAATDVGLQTEAGRTNANGGFVDTWGTDANNVYTWGKRTRVFTAAQANGNLTEIGMFQYSSGAPIWCRQLIRDANGTPTTITKTSEYELRAVYELRLYPEVADVVTSTVINGTAQNVTSRRAFWGNANNWNPLRYVMLANDGTNCGVYTGVLGPITGQPSGTATYVNGVVGSYTAGSYQRTATVTYGATVANGTIKSLGTFDFTPSTQYELTNAVNKTDTQKLVAVFTSSWGRAVI